MRMWAREARLSRMMRLLSGARPMRNGSGSIDTRERWPLGSTTISDAGSNPGVETGAGSMAGLPPGADLARGALWGFHRKRAQIFYFTSPQSLAVRAIAAHFGARQQHLKSEVSLNLLPQALQRFAEKLFHLAAAQADDVSVLLLQPRLVVMLIDAVVHEVELIHQAAFLQHFQRPIDGDAVDLRIFFLGQLVKPVGVQMLTGLIDQLQ